MSNVRLARPEDLDKLAPVERSAASLFRDAGMDWLADGDTMDPAILAATCRNGTLWVAVAGADEPVGFLAAHELDGRLFIAEVSVSRSHQRQGHGARLIETAVNHARAAGFPAVTLTTDRSLAWNGPYYARLGFAEIDPAEAGPGHCKKLQSEVEAGLDPARRCVMEMKLSPPAAA